MQLGCQLCDYRAFSKPSIYSHLWIAHKIQGSEEKAHYWDKTPIYKDEIIQMIERCFGQTNSVR